MQPPSTSEADTAPAPTPTVRQSLFRSVFNRMLGGVLFLLPVIITLALIYQIYLLIHRWVVEPVARLIIPAGIENEYWRAVETYITPPLALVAVLAVLYLAGYAFETRLYRWVNWCFARVPGVSTLYRAVQDVLGAMRGPGGLRNVSTVVLVPFPHIKARMAGFLMGESTDSRTGERLACVYIPIGVFPPSGYTLVLPYEQIIVTDWEATSPWKLLLSGGLTLPNQLPFANVPEKPSAEYPETQPGPDNSA